MALNRTVKTVFGFDVVNSYSRVEGISIQSKNILTFRVRDYKDVLSPSFGDSGHSCQYDINGLNPIAQAYLYLKTLPEFSGAVDC